MLNTQYPMFNGKCKRDINSIAPPFDGIFTPFLNGYKNGSFDGVENIMEYRNFAKMICVMTLHEKIIQQAAVYISENLNQSLTVNRLSRQFHISRAALQRRFKQRFHRTIHQFILEKRLEKAHTLLAQTNKPVKEIMVDAGFKSLSSFTRKFHKRFRVTPAQLRNH